MIATEAEARDYCRDVAGEDAMQRFERFVESLAFEARSQNLVAATTLEQVWRRHIADSLQLLEHVPRETSPWLDLGTGAGFPGLVIASARPSLQVRLVESRRKRADWLVTMIDHLALDHCTVIARRLQRVDSFAAAVISARAFAPLGRLLDLSTRFSTAQTAWLLPKGRSAAKELEQLSPESCAMFHVEQSRTEPGAGILVGRGRPHNP